MIIMKRFLILTLVFIPMLVYAQNKFEPQLKVSYELGIDKDKNQSFGGEFLAGYRMSDDFRLGVGTGIYWCELLYEDAHYNSSIHYYSKEYRETASYIPIFLNGKYNIISTGDWRPYIAIDFGYAIFNSASKYADNNKLGIYTKPAFGVDYSIGKGSLFMEVGYKYQDRKIHDTKMGYSQLTMSIGYQF